MASSSAGGPDQATVAFRRLLVDAGQDEQARVDALMVMSRRTVFAATWPGQRDAVRTLTNPQGQMAMPVFTGTDTMGAAAVQFGWLNADGSLDFREMGAREALRHALARGVHFMVVDLAAPSMVEFARGELEPVLHMAQTPQREPTGPFAVGGEPEAMFRAAVRESSKPPAGGRGSFIPPAVSLPSNPPPEMKPPGAPALTGPAMGTSDVPPRPPRSDAVEAFDPPGFEPSSEPPSATMPRVSATPSGPPEVMAPQVTNPPPDASDAGGPGASIIEMDGPAGDGAGAAAERPGAPAPNTGGESEESPASPPSDPGHAADPGHDLSATAKQLAARVVSGTEQARSLALRMAGRLGGALQRAGQQQPTDGDNGDGDEDMDADARTPRRDPGSSGEMPAMAPEDVTGTRPITRPPPAELHIDDEILDAIGGALRGYPEVEWACALPDPEARAVIGLRVDPSFDARAEEIRALAVQTADKHGVALLVELVRSPDEMKRARREGTVFFPGRRRAVPRT